MFIPHTNPRYIFFRYEGEGGGDGGEGDGKKDKGPSIEEQIRATFEGLVSRQGSADAAGLLLFQENKDYRDRIRELEKQLPGEGATVLSPADAALWQGYRDLGGVDDLKGALTERDTLKEQVQAAQRQNRIREAAEMAGYKPTILADLLREAELEIEGEGESRKAVIVTGEERTPLADHAEQAWKEYLPVLKVERDAQGRVTESVRGSNGKKLTTEEENELRQQHGALVHSQF